MHIFYKVINKVISIKFYDVSIHERIKWKLVIQVFLLNINKLKQGKFIVIAIPNSARGVALRSLQTPLHNKGVGEELNPRGIFAICVKLRFE